MCVSGVKAPLLLNVSHVVLVLPISAKLLACSQFEHLVVPYFFGLALIFCLFFQGGEGRENPTSNWPNHQHVYAAGGIEASWRRWRCFLEGATPLNLHVAKGRCCKMVSMGTIFNRILYEGHRDLCHRYFYNKSCIWTGKCCWKLQSLRWKWYTLEDTLESGGSIQTAERYRSAKSEVMFHTTFGSI